MSSLYKGELKPQLEEGITQAVFKDTEATLSALKNTFSNIILVFQYYKKLLKK
jgi:hypothetical protein